MGPVDKLGLRLIITCLSRRVPSLYNGSLAFQTQADGIPQLLARDTNECGYRQDRYNRSDQQFRYIGLSDSQPRIQSKGCIDTQSISEWSGVEWWIVPGQIRLDEANQGLHQLKSRGTAFAIFSAHPKAILPLHSLQHQPQDNNTLPP